MTASELQHSQVPFQISETFDQSGSREAFGSLYESPSVYRDGVDGPRANNIVMVGGVDLQSLDPDVPGRCVFGLHNDTHEWEELGSLDEYTHHHGVAVVDGRIYVIGKLIKCATMKMYL